jgi:hypothetical protein
LGPKRLAAPRIGLDELYGAVATESLRVSSVNDFDL